MKGGIAMCVVVFFASACSSNKQATKGQGPAATVASKTDAAAFTGRGGYNIQSDWDKKIGSIKIDSQADRVGAAAIDTLVMGGPASAPKIADYLADTSPMVREKAVKALASFGPKAEPALGRIARLCRDPDPGIRTSATKAAALIGHAAAKGILEKVQDDKAPSVRIWANAGLARMGDDCADRLEEIAELLGKSPRAAEEAAEAMAVV
ncbi:MAG: HEAT repeat domain-containing protein, partial [Deltaproteobacteria bacterium]